MLLKVMRNLNFSFWSSYFEIDLFMSTSSSQTFMNYSRAIRDEFASMSFPRKNNLDNGIHKWSNKQTKEHVHELLTDEQQTLKATLFQGFAGCIFARKFMSNAFFFFCLFDRLWFSLSRSSVYEKVLFLRTVHKRSWTDHEQLSIKIWASTIQNFTIFTWLSTSWRIAAQHDSSNTFKPALKYERGLAIPECVW